MLVSGGAVCIPLVSGGAGGGWRAGALLPIQGTVTSNPKGWAYGSLSSQVELAVEGALERSYPYSARAELRSTSPLWELTLESTDLTPPCQARVRIRARVRVR